MFDAFSRLFSGNQNNINLETASPAYHYFHELFILNQGDVRDGFDPNRIRGMTDEERAAAEPILIKSLKNQQIRYLAIMALGALQTQSAAEPIRSILKGASKKEYGIKIQSALALYHIEQNAQAFQMIKDIVQDFSINTTFRVEAVTALADMKTPEAKALLLDIFAKDPEYLVRYNAAQFYMIAQGIHFLQASNRVGEFMPFLRNPALLSAEERQAYVEKLRDIS